MIYLQEMSLRTKRRKTTFEDTITEPLLQLNIQIYETIRWNFSYTFLVRWIYLQIEKNLSFPSKVRDQH